MRLRTAIILTCGLLSLPAAAVAQTVQITEPAPGATVISQILAIRTLNPPISNPQSEGLTVRIDGALLGRCKNVNHYVGCDFYMPTGTGTWALPPTLTTLVGFDDPSTRGLNMSNYFASNPEVLLGYLTPGPHTLTVEFRSETSSARWPVLAQAQSTFTYAPSTRLSLIYENRTPRLEIFQGATGTPGLTPNRGAIDQGLSPATKGYAQAGRLHGAQLVTKTAREMADYLKASINRGCGGPTNQTNYCAGSGIVAVDEIGPMFADWSASQVQAAGTPGPGTRLAEALRLLAIPSRFGFRYSDKVHLYIAGVVVAKLPARGGGYSQVAAALPRAGGVWLEMYRGSSGSGARGFTASEWRALPTGIARRIGTTRNVHFLMTSAPTALKTGSCSSAMACQWSLAESGPTNRAILANGPGTYRVSDQALDWLSEFNARFPA